MKQPIFEEKQRFTQWWLWLIILGVGGLMLYKFFQKDALEENLTPIVITALGILLFFVLSLKTRIDQEGIHIKMFPFHFSYVTYKWENIYSVKTTTYSPLMEYGGWGVRISGDGKAFNVKGSEGIKLSTTDGKNRMIGTQKPKGAQKVIDFYKPKNQSPA